MDEKSHNSSDKLKRNSNSSNNIKMSEVDRLKTTLTKNNEDFQNRIKNIQFGQFEDLINKIGSRPIYVNRLDFYGNSIPLGSFCYAISFILLGFYESKVLKKPDKFVYLVLFFFGGLGQITTGILEYIKTRTFPTVVYLLYGIYFLSYFLFNRKYSNNNKYFVDFKEVFYGTWAGLSLPLFLGSISTNIIYCIQNFSVLCLFIVKCIGECKNSEVLKMNVSGILELVTGFLSLYLCFSQVLNEHYKKNILPTIKLKENNEIDISIMRK